MAIDYTTTALIASVKRRASVPTSQSLFESTDFNSILTDEMQSIIVPLIMAEQQDFFIHSKDLAIDGSTREFDIPTRAVGMKVKDVGFYRTSSNNFDSRPRLNISDFGDPQGDMVKSLGGFYLQGNKIVFSDAPTNTGDKLRVYYYRRPNNLIAENKAAKIASIDTGTKTLTFGSRPTAWTTSTTFDLIKGTPGFHSLADDATVSAIDTLTLTFTDDLPTGLAVGDWVGESGESPVAQIPYSAQPLLSQLGSVKILEALGDLKGMQMAQEKYQMLVQNFVRTISKRVDNSPKKIINRNGIFSGVRRRHFRNY